MELGDITRIVDRVSGGGGKDLPKFTQEQLDLAGNDFYKNLLGVLHGSRLSQPLRRPQEEKNPHVLRAFSNSGYGVVVEIDGYLPRASNQEITVLIRSLQQPDKVDVIKITRPESRTGLIVRKNGKKATPQNLKDAMRKINPPPEKQKGRIIIAREIDKRIAKKSRTSK